MDEKKPIIGWRMAKGSPPLYRQPDYGEWFASPDGFVLREGYDGNAVGPRFILDPIYADDPAPAGVVQVKRELVERMRKAYDELYAAHLRGADDDALRTLASVVTMRAHEIVVAVPPLVPEDPLESEEFRKDVEKLSFNVASVTRVDVFRVRIADAIRKWGPRAGGAK